MITVYQSDRGPVRATDVGGTRGDGVEDRHQIRWLRGNRPQHLGRGRLLLQRLAELPVALLQLLEEPGVLDGDHRLIRKCLQHGDLSIAEWTYLVPNQSESTDGCAVPDERHDYKAPKAKAVLWLDSVGEVRPDGLRHVAHA